MKQNILKLMRENNEAGLLANIHQQTDVKFVDEAADIISKLRDLLDNSSAIRTTENLIVDSKEGSSLIKELEVVLNNRFISNSKASFKLLAAEGGDAFCNVITPNTAKSIMIGKEISVEKELKDVIYTLETYYGASRNSDPETEISFNNVDGYKAIMERNIKSAKELEKKLEVGSVDFDLKNAKINGLPDDMYFIIAIDYVYFINNFSDRELVSVMAHEIGHIFNTLSDMYRTADTNVVLYDIMSSMDMKNPEKVTLTMAKEFNIPAPNLSKKGKEREVMLFVSNLMDSVAKNNYGNTKNRTASERLADQFPVRFGLGVEYFNVNKKINFNIRGYSEVDYLLDIPQMASLSNFALVVGLAALLLVVLISAELIGITAVYLVFVGVFKTMMLISRFMVGTDDANSTIYDDSKRRLESVRNDFVRRINSVVPKDKLERELIRERILELEIMDKEISNFRKNRSFVGMIGEFIMPSLRKKSKETMINELLENMEANKLQVLSEKLKLSGGL